MSVKLNLDERYYISMYSRRLPCTLRLRFAIDAFLQQIEITETEMKEHGVSIDPKTMQFTCRDMDYMVEYADFHKDIIDSIKNYIKLLDHEKNADNELLQKTLTYFKKIV